MQNKRCFPLSCPWSKLAKVNERKSRPTISWNETGNTGKREKSNYQLTPYLHDESRSGNIRVLLCCCLIYFWSKRCQKSRGMYVCMYIFCSAWAISPYLLWIRWRLLGLICLLVGHQTLVFGVFQSKYGRFRVSNWIDANVDYFRCTHIFWSNRRYLRSSLISVTFTVKFMKTFPVCGEIIYKKVGQDKRLSCFSWCNTAEIFWDNSIKLYVNSWFLRFCLAWGQDVRLLVGTTKVDGL